MALGVGPGGAEPPRPCHLTPWRPGQLETRPTKEQLRAQHDCTRLSPADHSLRQPYPRYWGFRDLTKEEAKAIDAEHLRGLRGGHLRPVAQAA